MEVTQITGITNSGEITGFYSDAGGVAHSFTAEPTVVSVPETVNLAYDAGGPRRDGLSRLAPQVTIDPLGSRRSLTRHGRGRVARFSRLRPSVIEIPNASA